MSYSLDASVHTGPQKEAAAPAHPEAAAHCDRRDRPRLQTAGQAARPVTAQGHGPQPGQGKPASRVPDSESLCGSAGGALSTLLYVPPLSPLSPLKRKGTFFFPQERLPKLYVSRGFRLSRGAAFFWFIGPQRGSYLSLQKAQMATRRGVLSLLAWPTAERAQACVLSLKSPSHSGLNQRRTRGPRAANLQADL